MDKEKFVIDFIGIGAPKSGTSWVAEILAAHPQICMSVFKETSFFCGEQPFVHNRLLRYQGNNIQEYSLFFKHCVPNKIQGEFSVNYMVDENSAAKIFSHFPNVKLIAVLRNPIDRMISDYRYRRFMRKEESRPLEEILKEDEFIVRCGMYSEQLGRYFRLFPKENIKILIYEEVVADPRSTIKNLYSFLGVDPFFEPADLLHKVVNEAAHVRARFVMAGMHQIRLLMIKLGLGRFVDIIMKLGFHKFMKKINLKKTKFEKIDQQLKNKIRDFYKGDRLNLEQLLGRSLSCWE
ncbi:MAG TPA: sulfotransferase domain-containing protein [Candidatus Paceibacterota bacterium]